MDTRITVPPSRWAQETIRLPLMGGTTRMQFDERRYLLPIYDGRRDVLFKCGRQVEKSTTLANLVLSYASSTQFFKALYITPTALQSKQFSEDRLRLVMESSPLLDAMFPRKDQAIFRKMGLNGSQILLRAAFLSAARTRGLTVNMLVIDEFQSIITDLVPVIEQTTFHSPWSRLLYSGTPLTEDNGIEVYWREYSTQNEWVVPCRRHGTPNDPGSWHWNILGPDNIGRHGLVCDRCGQPIDAQDPDARWVRMVDPRGREERVSFEGFHIPQVMMPFITKPENWADLLRKIEQYPTYRTYNEIWGLPYSRGTKPITSVHLRRISDDRVVPAELEQNIRQCHGNIYAGIDWGGGGSDDSSRTVISVGGYFPGSTKFKILWSHAFTSQEDPEEVLEMLVEFINKFKPQHIGVDYGGGLFQNNRLMRTFGHDRVHIYQYVGRQRSGKIVYSKTLHRHTLSRGDVMGDLFAAMRDGLLTLPRWQDYRVPYGQDILNINQEYNAHLDYTQYTHAAKQPDDTFHSILYALLASLFDRPRPDIFAPSSHHQLEEDEEELWAQMMEDDSQL